MSAATGADRRPLAGIGMMLLGVFLFSANDVMGKWLVSTYPVGEVVVLRSLAALAVLWPFLAREGWGQVFRPARPGLQLVRVAFSSLEVASFYWAVAYLPLADVMTYWLAAPVYVVVLSALLLGERTDLHRSSAVAAGFAGVLVALGPSAAALSLPALVSVAGSALFALTVITTRQLRSTSVTALVAYQTAGALVLGLALLPFGWVIPTALDLAALLLLGIVSMTAHVCATRSLTLAPAPLVVPYQYTFLVWAVAFGYLVFGDVPGPATLLGAGLIVAAGLYLLALEQRSR